MAEPNTATSEQTTEQQAPAADAGKPVVRFLTDEEERSGVVAEPAQPATPTAEATPAAEPAAPVAEPATPAALSPNSTATPPASQQGVNAEPAPQAQPTPATPEAFNPWKELGITEEQRPQFEKLINAAKGGKLDEYVNIATRNFDTVTDLDLIRENFDKEYSALSREDRDELFTAELQQKYGFEGDISEADKIAQLRIKAEGSRLRNAAKEAQANYTIPEYKAPEAQVDPKQLEAQREHEEFVKKINADPYFSKFETNRLIQLGSNEYAVNYEVPKTVEVRNSLYDGTFWNNVLDKDGQLLHDKWVQISAFSADPDGFIKTVFDAGKAAASKEAFVENRNIPPANGAVPQPAQQQRRVVFVDQP